MSAKQTFGIIVGNRGFFPDHLARSGREEMIAVLKKAGMSADNVVSVQVYLTDGATFARMNTVYTAFFKEPRPTRTTVVVAKLVGPGRIEITATARK